MTKSYGEKAVVDDVSFTVRDGEVFGLIGPNGAGKTTTIRMIMDIIKPDSGEILVFGEKSSEESKGLIGYLPEERGLYRKLRVIDSLTYLASLKGMDRHAAARRAEELMDQVGMLPHKNKKIEELSRGMGQMIQFLVTIIHDPRLIILDEPFGGLDPVNTERLKEMVLGLKTQGKALILSTHRMNEIEALSDRIFMVNKGKAVLYGGLAEIRSRYRNNSVILESETDPGQLEGVTGREDFRDHIELFLDGKTSPQELLQQLVNKHVKVTRFEISTPSLNQIFIQIAGENP